MYHKDGVKKERSSWRDDKMSQRRRTYGFNVPMIDIDCIEVDNFKPIAIMEWKHESAGKPSEVSLASMTIQFNLAEMASLPFYGVRYADNLSWFNVRGLNSKARDFLGTRDALRMNEIEYVHLLYRIRGRECPADILARLNTESALSISSTFQKQVQKKDEEDYKNW